MAEVNLRSWPEISQASEGLQLKSTAATLEYISAWLARLETRLVEHERRVAATLPPLQPEPDPPDRPQLNAASQPQFQSTSHQPCYTAGQIPTLHPLPQYPPTCWNPPIQHQQLGLQQYGQPSPHQPSCWDQPDYQPARQLPPPYTYTDSYELLRSPYAGPQNPPMAYDPPRQAYSYHEQPCWPVADVVLQEPCNYTDSDALLQNSYAEYHPWQHKYQPTQLPSQSPLPRSDCPLQSPQPQQLQDRTLLKQIEIPRSTGIDGSVRVLYSENGTTQHCLDKAHAMKQTSDVNETLPSENNTPGNVFIEGTQKQLESGSQSILSADETCVVRKEGIDESIENAKDDHPDENGLLLVQDFFKGKQLFHEIDKDGIGQVPLKVFDIAMAHRNLPRRYAKEFFKLTRSRMFPKSVIVFDPGGETSTLLFSPNLFVDVVDVASWFPP